MPIRLIALDMDGTLLDDRSRLPDVNRDAVVEASTRGMEIAIVTGRRYDFAIPVARQIPCPLTMITNNGALVKSHTGATQFVRLLPCDVATRVLRSTSGFREMASVYFHRPRENQLIFERIDWDDPLRKGYFIRNREFIAEMSPLEHCLTEDPLQVMFTGSAEESREIASVLAALPFAAEYSLAVTVYESRDFGLVDVISPGCSKGSTLAAWVEQRGWTRADVMAVGDNFNDLEMLQYAGLPVVMGNSVPELKSLGMRETLTNDEGGVAVAIAQYAFGSL